MCVIVDMKSHRGSECVSLRNVTVVIPTVRHGSHYEKAFGAIMPVPLLINE